MPARALVVMDYQNIHLTAHELWAPPGTAKHETLVHPLNFAQQVIGSRNNRLVPLIAAGRTETPPLAEVAAVAVYRGLPSQRHSPAAYRRSMAQQSEWTRDRRVEVQYRTLRYQWNGDSGLYEPREKGIDVLVALRVVRAAEIGDYDVVILCSHDTDLEPALDDACGRGTCRVETAGWQNRRVLKGNEKLWHTALGASEFVRARDRKDYT